MVAPKAVALATRKETTSEAQRKLFLNLRNMTKHIFDFYEMWDNKNVAKKSTYRYSRFK
jgi:hypothetical protein